MIEPDIDFDLSLFCCAGLLLISVANELANSAKFPGNALRDWFNKFSVLNGVLLNGLRSGDGVMPEPVNVWAPIRPWSVPPRANSGLKVEPAPTVEDVGEELPSEMKFLNKFCLLIPDKEEIHFFFFF